MIVFTKFINTLKSRYVKDLNWHGCIKQEEQDIVIDTKNYSVFYKYGYTAYNDELKQLLIDNKIDIDACMMKTIIDLCENSI